MLIVMPVWVRVRKNGGAIVHMRETSATDGFDGTYSRGARILAQPQATVRVFVPSSASIDSRSRGVPAAERHTTSYQHMGHNSIATRHGILANLIRPSPGQQLSQTHAISYRLFYLTGFGERSEFHGVKHCKSCRIRVPKGGSNPHDLAVAGF